MAKKKPMAGMQLEAMAIEIPEVAGHPNRVTFSGVLTRLDQPSDRAPSGAAGHRVMLPRVVAERALPSLLGMAVDFSPGLKGHDVQRKIGVITRAEIAGDRLEVAGYLFGKDFPEVIAEIRAARTRLGMSYEVTGVKVADPRAEIWRLENVMFTGAAILERSAAAYEQTSLAANGVRNEPTGGKEMDDKLTQTLDQLAQASQALTAEFTSLRAMVEELGKAQDSLAKMMEIRPGRSIAAANADTHGVRRKTVPPQVLTLLAKSGVGTYAVGADGAIEIPVLDKALAGLPVEQRMAVKSQLARAGAIE
ncbi:MAG: hypothetical protein HY046_09795 [Acidobacteria bacterium]|nr:hypothetical protein [Acidobacteriota bacterium]